MGRNKLIVSALGAIVTVALGIDYANSFHTFTSWAGKLPPNESTKMLYDFFVWAFQPVTAAGHSIPLVLALLTAAIIGRIFVQRRRQRRTRSGF